MLDYNCAVAFDQDQEFFWYQDNIFFSKFDSTDKHKTFILIWKYTLFFILLQASKVWAAILVPHFLKIRKDQNDEFVNMDKLQKKLLGFPHICQTSTNCTGR